MALGIPKYCRIGFNFRIYSGCFQFCDKALYFWRLITHHPGSWPMRGGHFVPKKTWTSVIWWILGGLVFSYASYYLLEKPYLQPFLLNITNDVKVSADLARAISMGILCVIFGIIVYWKTRK